MTLPGWSQTNEGYANTIGMYNLYLKELNNQWCLEIYEKRKEGDKRIYHKDYFGHDINKLKDVSIEQFNDFMLVHR